MNENEDILQTMISSGILETLVDIFSNESDARILVCYCPFSISLYHYRVVVGDQYSSWLCASRAFRIDWEC